MAILSQTRAKLNPILRVAVQKGSLELLNTAIAAECRLDLADGRGRFVLHLAVAGERLKILERLLVLGASPHVTNASGQTPLELAQQTGRAGAAEMLQSWLQSEMSEDLASDAPDSYDSSQDDPFGIGDWEAVVESIAPEQDVECLAAIALVQNARSEFKPIDRAVRWDDVNIELPDVITQGDWHGGADPHELKMALDLVTSAAQVGHVSPWLVEQLFDTVGRRSPAAEARVRRIISSAFIELGIVVESRPTQFINPPIVDEIDEPTDILVDLLEYLTVCLTTPDHHLGHFNRQAMPERGTVAGGRGDPFLQTEAYRKHLKRGYLSKSKHAYQLQAAKVDVRDSLLENPVTLQWLLNIPSTLDSFGRTARELLTISNDQTAESALSNLSAQAEILRSLVRACRRTVDLVALIDQHSRDCRADMRRAVERMQLKWKTVLLLVEQARLVTGTESEWHGSDEKADWLQKVDRCLAVILDARNRIVSATLRLVVSSARYWEGRGVPIPDLVQEGAIGLMRAADTFDPSKVSQFSHYAKHWTRQSQQRAIADKSRLVRVPVHVTELAFKVEREMSKWVTEHRTEPTTHQIAQSLDADQMQIRQALHSSHEYTSFESIHHLQVQENTPFDDLAKKYLSDDINRLLENTLKAREALVIRHRFGLDGPEMTLEDIGRLCGVTRERIRQIESKAIQKLRHPARRKALEPHIVVSNSAPCPDCAQTTSKETIA